MSKYNKTYSLGQFRMSVTSNNSALIGDFDNYLHPAVLEEEGDLLKLHIEDNAMKVKALEEMIRSNKYDIVQGYMKTPFKHVEMDDAIINYDEKHNVFIIKHSFDDSIEIVLDTHSSTKFESIPMYIAREMIIRKNENLGNTILHSASVFHEDQAYAIVGGPGAGKTSLLLGLLKGSDGKVGYVSNDINFVTPDLKKIYPFQIPMLLSDATADSYFGDKKLSIMKDTPTISYFHEKDKEMITKFKIDRKSVEELFRVNSLNQASFGGIIIPQFDRSKKGFSVQIVDKEFAKELIDGQVLEGDDRFSVDYLGLREGAYNKTDYILDPIVDGTPIVCVTYGKDIFEKENIDSLINIFKFLQRSNMKRFELHTHTTSSDGRLSPEQTIDKAIDQELDMIAITDHNTVDGVRKARQYMEEKGVAGLELINGVELDANDVSCLHILGYGIQDLDQMEDYLQELEMQNNEVYLKIISNLQGMGVDISPEQVREFAGTDKLTKQWIGEYLKAHGYATDSADVTQKYLGKGCPAYVSRIQPTAKECIDLIHRCGGISVLAHPMELMKYNDNLPDEESVYEYIKELQKLGLDGVECCTYKHTSEQEMDLIDLCDRSGLVKTIGNDYHGRHYQNFGTDEIDIIAEFKLALSRSEHVM